MIVKQILLVSTLRKLWRTVWRMCILILILKLVIKHPQWFYIRAKVEAKERAEKKRLLEEEEERWLAWNFQICVICYLCYLCYLFADRHLCTSTLLKKNSTSLVVGKGSYCTRKIQKEKRGWRQKIERKIGTRGVYSDNV